MESFLDQAVAIASEALGDWRFWFVHVCTWTFVYKTKVLWDSLRPAKRRRVTELVSAGVAASFALWAFTGEEHAVKIAVSMGLISPYLYKFLVGAVGHYRPEWVAWLKPKRYVLEVVESQDSGEKTALYIREDGEKTVRLSATQLDTFRGSVEGLVSADGPSGTDDAQDDKTVRLTPAEMEAIRARWQ